MYFIKDSLRGVNIFFDVENKVVMVLILCVLLSSVGFFESYLKDCICIYFGILIGIVSVGSWMFFFGFFILGSFENVCEFVF